MLDGEGSPPLSDDVDEFESIVVSYRRRCSPSSFLGSRCLFFRFGVASIMMYKSRVVEVCRWSNTCYGRLLVPGYQLGSHNPLVLSSKLL